MTRPHLASAQFFTTDTSADPERYAIVVPNEALEYAYVLFNTGHGWIEVGDFADYYAAERWIERQEEDNG